MKTKFQITAKHYWHTTRLVTLFLIYQNVAYSGVSDHLARETIIKHIEGNTVANISQYSNLTYMIELIALGLVAAALLAVTFSIYVRVKSGKKEQKKILSLRRSAEHDKKIFDETIAEINNIGKKIQTEATETQQQLNQVNETVKTAEKQAENITSLELDMKQLVDGTTERMTHIQQHWEQQLKDTTDTISQINGHLENSLGKTAEQSKQAESLLSNLSNIQNSNQFTQGSTPVVNADNTAINAEIKETLDLTLKESKDLLIQIKDYQEQAKAAFTSFTSTLGGFESQAHEQFDDIFNTADIARQELNANLDESREYMKIFRKEEPQQENLVLEGIDKLPANSDKSRDEGSEKNKKVASESNNSEMKEKNVESPKIEISQRNIKERKGRPIINMHDAEDLTDPSLIKSYGKTPIENPDYEEDKNLVSLFSKFRHHGS